MKNSIRISALGAALFALAAVAFAASQLTVQVSNSRVRKDAKFWASSVTSVSAGDRLTEIESRGDWYKVKTASGAIGWIHGSAVTTKKITLGAGSETAARNASADEISLAGKGFTESVEKQYRKSNGSLDFAGVDRMAGITVTDKEVETFLKEGKLAEWGAAR